MLRDYACFSSASILVIILIVIRIVVVRLI